MLPLTLQYDFLRTEKPWRFVLKRFTLISRYVCSVNINPKVIKLVLFTPPSPRPLVIYVNVFFLCTSIWNRNMRLRHALVSFILIRDQAKGHHWHDYMKVR